MNDAVKKQEEHRRIKPELKEGDGEHQSPDTIETLETRIKEQEPKMIEIAEKKGAINTLRSLHTKSGRHVGIISHVEELQERIPIQIQVIQEGNNSSSKVKIIPEVPRIETA